MLGSLVMWVIVTAAFVALGLTLAVTGHPVSHVDMLLGMGLGISTGPIMMAALMRWRTRSKVKKMLNDIIQMRKEQTSTEENTEKQEEPVPL